MATIPGIRGLRLERQGILARNMDSPQAVVKLLGALQGQDLGSVTWSIGLRMDPIVPAAGANAGETGEAAVEAAFSSGAIVRSWTMRGTLHVVPAEDLGWMLRLLAGRTIRKAEKVYLDRGLDGRTLNRCFDIIGKALAGGAGMTREQLMDLIEAEGIETGRQRGYNILARAGQTGLICMGPMRGKQPAFVLCDEWIPRPVRMDSEEAATVLLTRYFHGHGPAAIDDFIWWSGMAPAEARAALEAVGPGLVSFEAEGRRYWMAEPLQGLPQAARSTDAAPSPGTVEEPGEPVVRLLPGFDEYVLGYTDRSAFLAPEHTALICPGGNGVFSPTISVNGRIAGTWKRYTSKKGDTVVPRWFDPADAFDSGLGEEIENLLRFYGSAITE